MDLKSRIPLIKRLVPGHRAINAFPSVSFTNRFFYAFAHDGFLSSHSRIAASTMSLTDFFDFSDRTRSRSASSSFSRMLNGTHGGRNGGRPGPRLVVSMS